MKSKKILKRGSHKKRLVALTGVVFLTSLVALQEVYADQNVQCTVCFLEKHGTTTATTCETTQVRLAEAPKFFYKLGYRLGQVGIKEWSLSCNAGKKKVKVQGKFEEEPEEEKGSPF